MMGAHLQAREPTHADEASGVAEDAAGDAGDAREVGVANTAPSISKEGREAVSGCMAAVQNCETGRTARAWPCGS
jgi:hypothetical protein